MEDRLASFCLYVFSLDSISFQTPIYEPNHRFIIDEITQRKKKRKSKDFTYYKPHYNHINLIQRFRLTQKYRSIFFFINYLNYYYYYYHKTIIQYFISLYELYSFLAIYRKTLLNINYNIIKFRIILIIIYFSFISFYLKSYILLFREHPQHLFIQMQ